MNITLEYTQSCVRLRVEYAQSLEHIPKICSNTYLRTRAPGSENLSGMERILCTFFLQKWHPSTPIYTCAIYFCFSVSCASRELFCALREQFVEVDPSSVLVEIVFVLRVDKKTIHRACCSRRVRSFFFLSRKITERVAPGVLV